MTATDIGENVEFRFGDVLVFLDDCARSGDTWIAGRIRMQDGWDDPRPVFGGTAAYGLALAR